MALAFTIPDTAPFIHYDPLTRWTTAYAPAKDGRGGDETYHQAGVAMAGIDLNITASTLNFQMSASPLAPAASNMSDTSAPLSTGCGLLISINGSTPTSTCSLTDLPHGIHRVSIKAEREGTRVLGIDGEVAAYGMSRSKRKSKGNGGPRRVIDDKAPEWKYQGSWTSLDSSSGADVKKYGELKRYQGGSASVSGGTARAQLDFQGEAIWLYGFSGPYGGAARVWMDGVEMANLNMTLPWAGYQSLLFFQAGLDGGASHTLTFDALGKGEVVLDYAVVMGSSDENWLQANLPTVIGGISGLLALILLLCLGTYLYLLQRSRRIREAHGWPRIPGSGVFGARYLPPGQAHSVEQWRKTSSLKGEGMEMYPSEDGHGFGDKGSVSSPSAALLAGGALRGVVRGYHHAGSPGYSPSRSLDSRMRALPHTASSTEYGRVQPGSASIASTLLSPPVAYRSPGMSASASPGPIGSNPLQGNSSPFPFHVNRPPASPGYLPYTGPIEASPYSTNYASGGGNDYANSRSRLPGVVGGSAAAREWLQRSMSRRSKASTATVRSAAGSRAGTPLRGAAGSVVGSGSAKSDISSVLGTGTSTSRTHSRGMSASGHSIVSPHTPLSGGHVSSSSKGQGRGLVGPTEPDAAYGQPGWGVRNSPHGGSGREELEEENGQGHEHEHEHARERGPGHYEEDKRREMADWARSVGSRTPLFLSSAGTATAAASMMERGSDGRIRSQSGSTSAHMSSVSGFSSELGEPFTAMIGTISANPLSHPSTGLERGGSADTGINKRESDRDIIAKYWPITAASPHPQRDTLRGSSTEYFDSGDRIERTIDSNSSSRAEQHQQHDQSPDGLPVQRTPPRLPLSVSSRVFSVAGAAPSSRILPSSGGITPASTGVIHTPISAPVREIALTPATSMTTAHSGSLLRSSDNPVGSDAKDEIIGKSNAEPHDGIRRSMRSVKSSKTDRSYLSFLRGPGEDPWSFVIGRAGVQGGDAHPHAHAHSMPAMPQTAARPDSQMIHPYGRKSSVGTPLRADMGGVGVGNGVGAGGSAEGRMRDDGDTDGRVAEKHGKAKKLPPPPLGLGLLHPSLPPTSVAGSARVSVPVSEEGMRNWVIELDPNSPTTTVGRSVSRPHSYARGW